jgi:hypothetical protein
LLIAVVSIGVVKGLVYTSKQKYSKWIASKLKLEGLLPHCLNFCSRVSKLHHPFAI